MDRLYTSELRFSFFRGSLDSEAHIILLTICRNLGKYFRDTASNLDLSEKILEDIKVRTCFVTTLERSAKLGTENAPAPPSDVTYPGVKRILIPGEIREKAFEILWERDNDNLSLPTMILDAIVKVKPIFTLIFCHIHNRAIKFLTERIFLILHV